MIFQCDPSLEDLLGEPIIQQVMLSDGVHADDIRELARLADIGRGLDGAGDALPAAYAAPVQAFGCGASPC